MNTYTICMPDGEFIADRVSRPQINRLCGFTEDGHALRRTENGELIFGTRLIRAHKKRNYLYLSLVDASVIRAELHREFSANFRGAEDCYTVSRETFANDIGAGWLYMHNRRASHYNRSVPADECEQTIRITLRKHRNAPLLPSSAINRIALRAPLQAR